MCIASVKGAGSSSGEELWEIRVRGKEGQSDGKREVGWMKVSSLDLESVASEREGCWVEGAGRGSWEKRGRELPEEGEGFQDPPGKGHRVYVTAVGERGC